MTREEALRLALEATPNDPAKAIQTARDMLAFLSEEPKSAFPSPASKPPAYDPGLALPVYFRATPDDKNNSTPNPNPPDVAYHRGLTEQERILLGLNKTRRQWTSAHDDELSLHIQCGDSGAIYDAAVSLRRSVKSCYCRAARLFTTAEDSRTLTRMYRFARNRLMEETGQHGTL